MALSCPKLASAVAGKRLAATAACDPLRTSKQHKYVCQNANVAQAEAERSGGPAGRMSIAGSHLENFTTLSLNARGRSAGTAVGLLPCAHLGYNPSATSAHLNMRSLLRNASTSSSSDTGAPGPTKAVAATMSQR